MKTVVLKRRSKFTKRNQQCIPVEEPYDSLEIRNVTFVDWFPQELIVRKLSIVDCHFRRKAWIDFSWWLRCNQTLQILEMTKHIADDVMCDALVGNRSILHLVLDEIAYPRMIINHNHTLQTIFAHYHNRRLTERFSYSETAEIKRNFMIRSVTIGKYHPRMPEAWAPYLWRNRHVWFASCLPIWAARNREGSFSVISIDVARIIGRMIFESRREECWFQK